MDEGGYQSNETIGGKVGCAVAAVTGIPLLAVALFLAIPFGDCPPNAPCHDGEGWRMLGAIVASAMVAGSLGFIVRRLVNALAASSRRNDS